jgi:hypothetical protein
VIQHPWLLFKRWCSPAYTLPMILEAGQQDHRCFVLNFFAANSITMFIVIAADISSFL